MKFRDLCIVGLTLAIAVLVPTSMVFATTAEDDLQEADKYYIAGDIEYEDPITVVFETLPDKAAKSTVVAPNYAFEKSVFTEDPQEWFLQNSSKVAATYNDRTKRTVVIDNDIYKFLVDFTNAYSEAYTIKTLPDLSPYYDLSNDMRYGNKLLVETYAYFLSITKSNQVLSVEKELQIKNVVKNVDNVIEVHFYLISVLNTDNGDETSGTECIANITNTVDGPKMVKFWVQDHVFENVQYRIKREVLPQNVRTAGNALADKLLNEYEAKKVSILTQKPVVDEETEPADKAANNDSVLRKATVSYDRSQVAAMAKKYAYNYIPLFFEESEDCTNFVSQCMWQSPGWKLETALQAQIDNFSQ